jgi:hypothetical protein
MATMADVIEIKTELIETGWICPNCKCGVNPKVRRCRCIEKNNMQNTLPTTDEEVKRVFGENASLVSGTYTVGEADRKDKIEGESISNHHLTEEHYQTAVELLEQMKDLPGYPFISEKESERIRAEAIVKEAAEKIKARGAGVILKNNEPTGELNISYGQDVRIKIGQYAGLHGAYVRDQVTERGMGKAIVLYSKDVQVVLMDDEIEVVDKDMKDWSVTENDAG